MIGEDSMKHHCQKKDFFSHLNMKNITDADYAHTKRICKDFKIENLGEYHNLYVQSDTLLLTDIFDNFRNMCFEILELDPACFRTTERLAWQAVFKKDQSKIRSIN